MMQDANFPRKRKSCAELSKIVCSLKDIILNTRDVSHNINHNSLHLSLEYNSNFDSFSAGPK